MNTKRNEYKYLKKKILNEPLNKEKLLKILKKYNKNQNYTDLIQKIETKRFNNMNEIKTLIKHENLNDKYENVIDFINNEGVNSDILNDSFDDVFKFLSISKKKGKYPEIFEYLKKNKINDLD